VPFAQLPLQHVPLSVQAWLSEMQLPPQWPPVQLREQQSVPDAHAPPVETHRPMVEPHVPLAASHDLEQHWSPL
jgi:hypothetical protein